MEGRARSLARRLSKVEPIGRACATNDESVLSLRFSAELGEKPMKCCNLLAHNSQRVQKKVHSLPEMLQPFFLVLVSPFVHQTEAFKLIRKKGKIRNLLTQFLTMIWQWCSFVNSQKTEKKQLVCSGT